jgi:glycosyltransferase involved in cell wall biosynthesis
MTKIFVIMSVLNSEKTVEKSIKGILSQNFEDFEFLILDDGSSDNTFKIVEKLTVNDSRVKLFKNEKNIGLTKSLNKLIEYSKGTYIARQDSDDESLQSRFRKQLDFINKYNLDGCCTLSISKQSKKIVNNLKSRLPLHFVIKYRNPFVHGTLMLKRKVLIDIGKYDENFYYAQDYKLMSDLIKSNYKLKILKNISYVLNTENNISTLKKKEQNYYANCVRNSRTP